MRGREGGGSEGVVKASGASSERRAQSMTVCLVPTRFDLRWLQASCAYERNGFTGCPAFLVLFFFL